MSLEFTCPKCSSHKIEEIIVDMTVAGEIRFGEGNRVDRGDQTNEGGHVDRYQCGECGYTITDDTSPHADDGLDEYALRKAIEALNVATIKQPNPDVPLVTHAELVRRFSDALEVTEGEAMANLWNETSPDEVEYIGDSMFRWVK